MPQAWLLHPAAVHFPLAFLLAGAAAALWGEWGGRARASQAAAWLIWAGAVSAWAALGLGLLAEKTVPHVPAAWQVLADHEQAGYWTCGLFTALAAWRSWGRHKRAWAVAWLLCLLPLIRTAQLGGQLVYDHAVGVNK